MADYFFGENFMFYRFNFEKYHYTDNRGGSPFNYIAYMIEGRSKLISDSDSIEVKPGECFYIPKGLPYESHWFGDKISFISLGFADIPTADEKRFILQNLECDAETTEKIKAIPTEMPVSAATLSEFYDVLARILPIMKSVPKSRELKLLERAKRYMENNPQCSAAQVCESCFISKSYLYYIFKRNMRMSPGDYRYMQLCRMAEKILLTTNKKVEDVAELLGFSSASYFRKTLKKYVGKTPKEIRKESII